MVAKRGTFYNVFQENQLRAAFVHLTASPPTLLDLQFYCGKNNLYSFSLFKNKTYIQVVSLGQLKMYSVIVCFHYRLLNIVMFENIQVFATKWLEQQLPPICWHPGTCFHFICSKITGLDHLHNAMKAGTSGSSPSETYPNPTTEESGLFVIAVVF